MVYGIGYTIFNENAGLFASPPAWSLQDAQFAEFFQETQKYRAAGPIRVLRSDVISFQRSLVPYPHNGAVPAQADVKMEI